MNRFVRVSLMFLLALAGCSTTRPTRMAHLTYESDNPIWETEGQPIAGYTLRDGTHHPFRGWARFDGRDSIQLSTFSFEEDDREEDDPILDPGHVRLMLPGSEFSTMDVKRLNPLGSALIAAGVLAGAILIISGD